MSRDISPIGKVEAVGAEAAMRAAVEYLARHSLEAEAGALCECLRSWIKIKLPEAMRDAKEALEAGMGAVAERTFLASMVLAGVEAAKEASFPRGLPTSSQKGA